MPTTPTTASEIAGLGCKEVSIEYGNDSCKLLLWEACDSASLSSAVDSRMGLGGAPFHLTLQGADTIVPLSSALPAGLVLSLNVGKKQMSVPFEIPPPSPARRPAPAPPLPPLAVTLNSPQRSLSEPDAALPPGCLDKDVSGVREDPFGGLLGPVKAASWPSTPVMRLSPKAKAPMEVPPFIALAGAPAPATLEDKALQLPPTGTLAPVAPSNSPSSSCAPPTPADLAAALRNTQQTGTDVAAVPITMSSSSSSPGATQMTQMSLPPAPASAIAGSTLPCPPMLAVPAVTISSSASAPASAPARSRDVELAEIRQRCSGSPAFGHDSDSPPTDASFQPGSLLRATSKALQELRHQRRLAQASMPHVAYSRIRSSNDLDDATSHAPTLPRETSSQLHCRIDTENVQEIAVRTSSPPSGVDRLKQRLLGGGLDEESEEAIFGDFEDELLAGGGGGGGGDPPRSKSRQSSQTEQQGFQDRQISGLSQGTQSGFTFAGLRSRAGSNLTNVEVAVVAVEEAVKSVDRFSRLSTDLANERTLLAWIRTVVSAMKVAILMVTVHGLGFIGRTEVFFSKFIMLLIMVVGTLSGIARYNKIKEALLLPEPPQKFGRPSIYWFLYLNVVCTAAAVLGLCLDVWQKN